MTLISLLTKALRDNGDSVADDIVGAFSEAYLNAGLDLTEYADLCSELIELLIAERQAANG